MRTIGITALGVLSIVARIGLGFVSQPHTDRRTGAEPASGSTVSGPSVPARRLQAGACIKDPYPSGLVHPVSCDVSHGTEIVGLVAYPAPPGGGYPTISALYGNALDLCQAAFEAYVGGTVDKTSARYFFVAPTSFEWREGERNLICFANARDADELTGSLRSSVR